MRGDFIVCRNEKITALSFDGGYAEYMIAPVEAVAAIPDGLAADEAAPAVRRYHHLQRTATCRRDAW